MIVTFSLAVGDFIGLAWFAGGFWVYFKVVLAWCFGVVLGCRQFDAGFDVAFWGLLRGVCWFSLIGLFARWCCLRGCWFRCLG